MTDKLSDAELISALNRIRDGWETEYRFHPSRKWRFDYAHPQLLTTCQEQANVYGVGNRHWVSINHAMPVFTQLAVIAVEIEGGLWMSVKGGKSRHFTGTGAKADMEKYNEAQIRGWSILRYPERSKAIIEDVHRFLNPPTEHTQRTWSMTETSTVIE